MVLAHMTSVLQPVRLALMYASENCDCKFHFENVKFCCSFALNMVHKYAITASEIKFAVDETSIIKNILREHYFSENIMEFDRNFSVNYEVQLACTNWSLMQLNRRISVSHWILSVYNQPELHMHS